MLKLLRALAPPLGAAALMIAAYAFAVQSAAVPFWAIDTWFKWDGGHYFAIADTGYEFMDCAGIPGFHPGQWCGNAGWFPGYPYFVRFMHAITGIETKLMALYVSQGFTLLSLFVVWNVFLSQRNLVLLLLCAFAPGTYYFLVVFPMSMTVFFMLLALWAQREQKHFLALLAGMVVGFTYPSGVVFSGVLAVALTLESLGGARPQPRAWLAVLGPVIGLGLVLVVHHLAVGQWNAFFLTQEKYKHGVNNPWTVLRDRLAYVWVWKPGWRPGLQSILAGSLVIIGAVGLVKRKTHPDQVRLAVHGLAYWIFPLVVGAGLSPYRAESLLMPAVAGLQRVPRLVLALLLLAALSIWFLMAEDFANGYLV